jgi:precorrin-6A/cobalt-precorrin-6A reductase
LRILLFGGTTEGREMAVALAERGFLVTVSVATQYGEEVLPCQNGITPHVGRMNREQMEAFLSAGKFDGVVDATHPYAQVVSREAQEAAKNQGVFYYRLCREQGAVDDRCITFSSVSQAVDGLAHTQGNILLAIGSKELKEFVRLPEFSKRCWARVLPSLESIQLCMDAGLSMSHIIAMQGPFSQEMNTATLRQIDARYLVTKESGRTGGFEEKQQAALQAGAKTVVILRPEDRGFAMKEILDLLEQKKAKEERGTEG